jgi:hypothetical protein
LKVQSQELQVQLDTLKTTTTSSLVMNSILAPLVQILAKIV